MDYGRIFGALLGGAAAPPRRRPAARRAAGPLGMTQTETRQIGRALGALASVAAEALAQSQPRAPAPPPPAVPRPAPAADEPIAPVRRIPETRAEPPPEPPPGAETAEARLILRAMIAAAKADGALDRAERAAIARQLDAAGLSAAERDLVLADFDNPATPEALARQARDPMLRAQLYAAAFAAAGEVSAAERAWLDRLGQALALDRNALAAIERRLGG